MTPTFYTEDKQIQLYLGDCLEIMPNLPPKSIDMVLCDPPYGTTACKWDTVIPLDLMWKCYFDLTSGAMVLFGNQPFTSVLGYSNVDKLKYSWTWEKSRPTGHLNAKKMPLKNTEDVLVFYAAPPHI